MSSATDKIASLRHLLAERFPTPMRPGRRALASGIPAIDAVCGGLPLGAVTEMVATRPSSGSYSVLAQLLASTRKRYQRAALIDASDCFDPGSLPVDHLTHLVWVRCQNCVQAVQAADLIARDANLNLVFLDLRWAAWSELRRLPGSQWYRLQRAAEPADLALLVLTPQACVPSAEIRFTLGQSHAFSDLEADRPVFTDQLPVALDRQRRSMAQAS